MDNNKLFVLPKNVSKAQLAKEVLNYLRIRKQEFAIKRKEIQQASFYICDAIHSNPLKTSWPPKPSELCESAITLPAVDTFLYTLMNGNIEVPTEYPQRVRRLMSSF